MIAEAQWESDLLDWLGEVGWTHNTGSEVESQRASLGDLVLRVCCFLEGLEITERRLGWSARSGKVVLKLALERLARHYADRYGPGGPLIG